VATVFNWKSYAISLNDPSFGPKLLVGVMRLSLMVTEFSVSGKLNRGKRY
jgi:hypothetical protein